MKTIKNNEIQIFQWTSWEIKFKGDLQKQTIWWNLNQISELFWKDKSTISRHIKNIYKTWKLSQDQSCCIFCNNCSRLKNI